MGHRNRARGGSEGPELEWKVVLPKDERVAATICSFANGCGGLLRVGISDGGEPVGLADPGAVRGELERIVRELLVGEVRLAISESQAQGKCVLEVCVEPSAERPVAVWAEDGEDVVFVRDGSSTRLADGMESRALGHSDPHTHRLEGKHGRLLRAILRERPARLAAVARTAHMGKKNAKRALVQLEENGLVMIRADGSYWLSPAGYRQLV